MQTDIIEPPVLIRMMENILTVMTANEDYLTRLDSEIGDADHGINMVRGFQLVHSRLKVLDNPDVEAILNTVGTSLMEGSGGSSGALYGIFFISGAQQLHGKRGIDKRNGWKGFGNYKIAVHVYGYAQEASSSSWKNNSWINECYG